VRSLFITSLSLSLPQCLIHALPEQPTLHGVIPASAHSHTNVTVLASNVTQTQDAIICRFGATISTGWYFNDTAVICQVPAFSNITQTTLSLGIALNGRDFTPNSVPFIYISPIDTPMAPTTEPVSPWLWWVVGGAIAALVIALIISIAIYFRKRSSSNLRNRYQRIPDGFESPPQDIAINPREIKVHERIGRGSFGDIYRYG